MVRDAEATKLRILDAAIVEFSAHGLAGARVERIAQQSGSNKRLIYVHYGSKEGLFGATLEKVLNDVADAVPLTIDDLPSYAGKLFDHLLVHPQALRLGLWRRLERPASGPDETGMYADKVAEMVSGRGGPDSGLAPIDLIVLIVGLAQAWFISPDDLLTSGGDDPTQTERIQQHRAALVEATRRLCGA
ncbi:TetR family transcriptional regulator [soil metagenome]